MSSTAPQRTRGIGERLEIFECASPPSSSAPTPPPGPSYALWGAPSTIYPILISRDRTGRRQRPPLEVRCPRARCFFGLREPLAAGASQARTRVEPSETQPCSIAPPRPAIQDAVRVGRRDLNAEPLSRSARRIAQARHLAMFLPASSPRSRSSRSLAFNRDPATSSTRPRWGWIGTRPVPLPPGISTRPSLSGGKPFALGFRRRRCPRPGSRHRLITCLSRIATQKAAFFHLSPPLYI